MNYLVDVSAYVTVLESHQFVVTAGSKEEAEEKGREYFKRCVLEDHGFADYDRQIAEVEEV